MLTNALKIIGGLILLAIAFGIAHDLVTASVCVEYFTEHHPKLVESRSPIVMALLWGVIATWWVGAGAGILLSWVANTGPRPILEPRVVVQMAAKALSRVWILSMSVLLIALLCNRFVLDMSGMTLRLWSVVVTHNFSYAAAAASGLVARRVWRARSAAELLPGREPSR